jgi:hypothetical protein
MLTGQHRYSARKHDLLHRAAAGTVDASHQLDLPCLAAADLRGPVALA